MKPVKKGDKLSVSIDLEFDGTIDAYAVHVEKTFIPTVNDSASNRTVKTDGDPIVVEATFEGISGSKVKKFELTINDKAVTVCEDEKLKKGELTIVERIPYSKFDLIEA